MRLQTLFVAMIICTSAASCANDHPTDSTWAVGVWRPIETDFDVPSGELIEFTKDGMSVLYDKNCNRLKEIEFLVRDGNIYVGSRDSESRFPPAIFYPSDDQTKLVYKSPGSELTVTYGKAPMSECRRQG